MAKTLKSLGLDELRSLRRRVRRQLGLERIGRADADYLTDLLNKAEARIVSMHEENENGMEESVE